MYLDPGYRSSTRWIFLKNDLKCHMMNISKCHSSQFHCSNVQNPVTVLHLTQDVAGSRKSPPESLDNRKGHTAATSKTQAYQSPGATVKWTTSKIGALGQEDESFAATGIQTRSAFIIWRFKNNYFLRLSYLQNITHQDRIPGVWRNAVSTMANSLIFTLVFIL